MKEPQTSLDRNPTGTEMHLLYGVIILNSPQPALRSRQLLALGRLQRQPRAPLEEASEDHRAALRERTLPARCCAVGIPPWREAGARRRPNHVEKTDASTCTRAESVERRWVIRADATVASQWQRPAVSFDGRVNCTRVGRTE